MKRNGRKSQPAVPDDPHAGAAPATLDDLKRAALERLTKIIKESDRPERAIELLGKMKENDWYVRPGAEPLGWIAVLANPATARIIEETKKVLPPCDHTVTCEGKCVRCGVPVSQQGQGDPS